MGEHVPTYREIALEQAVISHGTIQVPMSLPHSNYDAPNDPAAIAKAAVVYERFLDRSWRDGEEMADKLADALRATLGLFAEQSGAALEVDVLMEYDMWKAQREEPF